MNEGPASLLLDARRAARGGPAALAARQQARLADLVALARDRSPYYRERYRGLPERVEDPTALPVTGRPELMDRFDDWVTDRQVTLAEARAFMEDPNRAGKPFKRGYLVVSSSGTSGIRGTFVVSEKARRVADALRLRALARWLGAADAAKIVARGGRVATITGTGGHTIGLGVARDGAVRRRVARIFSIYTTLPDLVGQLNRFRPAVVNGGFGGMIGQLAAEQRAGRLRIDPVLVAPSGEALTPDELDGIGRAFDAKARPTYAAVECPFIGHGCARNWVHLNSDWVLLEPVDSDWQPVAPDRPSDAVLLTNLASGAQPIIRYPLDDSVVRRADRCPCGSPLPAIRVLGRGGEEFSFEAGGREVTVSGKTLATRLNPVTEVIRLQMVQTTPTSLSFRLALVPGADRKRAWERVSAAATGFLREQGLSHVALELADEPPQRSPGGKYRRSVPLGSSPDAAG